MSDLDVRTLEANFDVWRQERGDGLSISKAFERYVAEQVLRDFDVSDEEIGSGELGGSDDGGVDGIYLFMNGVLVTDETEPPAGTSTVELHLIQAKFETGFKESTIEKLEAFARDLLAYNKAIEDLKYLNSASRDAIRNFRDKYDVVMGRPHKLTIKFHYASKAVKSPGPKDKVALRASNLTTFVRSQLTAADVEFVPWSSRELLSAARSLPKKETVIPITNHFSADDGSTVCLIKLKDFAEKLLTDEHGNLQTRFLEPNVRDYAGRTNPVNEQIRATLEDKSPTEEFWWLNNGITILAENCPVMGNKISIRNPEIVNGLQTSHEIFSWYAERRGTEDKRNVLVRILLPTDERSRTRIVKATNSQTKVDDLSLMSTDRIQEDIEDKLKLYGLFYDRKKGEYRRLKKPVAKILGMVDVARCVIAIALQKPDQARGRPRTFVTKNPKAVFDPEASRDMYATCVLLDRGVYKYLLAQDLTSDQKRDIRFYVDMLAASALAKKANPTSSDLARLIDTCVKPLDENVLDDSCRLALETYQTLGGYDAVAKGSEMTDALVTKMGQHYGDSERTTKVG